MDFDDAERSEPTQTLELSEEDYKDEGLISLRYVKFQNVNSVTVCFSFSIFCHRPNWNLLIESDLNIRWMLTSSGEAQNNNSVLRFVT